MSGQHLDEELSAFLDGELDREEKARVSAHLESCPDCRTALQRLEQMSTFVRDLPLPRAPRQVTDAAMRLVLARSRSTSPNWFSRISEALTLRLGLGVVAGLAAAAIAVFVSLEVSEISVADKSDQTYSRIATVEDLNTSVGPPGAEGQLAGAAVPPGSAPPPGASGPLAGGAAPGAPGPAVSAADISGQLTVSNLQAAVQQVRSIASIVGGQEVGTPQQVAPGETIVVADIPEAQLSRLTAGLGLVGRWDVSNSLPPRPGSDVRVEIRISEGSR